MLVHRYGVVIGALWCCLASAGCHSTDVIVPRGGAGDCPREGTKVTLPDYTIEPPDILILDTLRLVPRPPYRVQPGDAIFIRATETPVDDPIKGAYRVEPDGVIRLGSNYGSIKVDEMTIEQATKALEEHLRKTLARTTVFVALEESARLQQVRGEHLVRPDGTISLGVYGRVNVTGRTQEDARKAVEERLSEFFVHPQISLDVAGFNSKVYYVIFDGGGSGEQVVRLPVTGNETVLDAIGQLQGLPAVSCKKRIWIARPSPANHECDQILGVDWIGITQRGRTGTNYQLLPGDRIYVQADPLIRIDTMLAKIISPLERIMGVTLLGNSTIRSVNGSRNGGNGSGNGGGNGGFGF